MKKQLFILTLLVICLFALSGCKSDFEKVEEEERNYIDVPYADISVLELSDEEVDTKYKELIKDHESDYIKWTGKISTINSLFNELSIKEEGLPKLVIDFEFEIADYLKENGYKENDIITISALLHDYIGGKGGFLELKNGRVEKTSENEKNTVLDYQKVYKEKKDIANKEAEKKAKVEAEEQIAKEIIFYQKELSPKIEAYGNALDLSWTTYWEDTFTKVSSGSMDKYEAYNNMKLLQSEHDKIQKELFEINFDGLSKTNAKLFKDYRSSMDSIMNSRNWAIRTAKKMFDEGEFKPSKFESINADLHEADKSILDATASHVEIEKNLGIYE